VGRFAETPNWIRPFDVGTLSCRLLTVVAAAAVVVVVAVAYVSVAN